MPARPKKKLTVHITHMYWPSNRKAYSLNSCSNYLLLSLFRVCAASSEGVSPVPVSSVDTVIIAEGDCVLFGPPCAITPVRMPMADMDDASETQPSRLLEISGSKSNLCICLWSPVPLPLSADSLSFVGAWVYGLHVTLVPCLGTSHLQRR